MNHANTPWRTANNPYDAVKQKYLIHDKYGEHIAETMISDLGEANAEFIVTACNAHEDLVEACKRAEYFFQQITDAYKGPNYAEAFKAVSSALAKAGVKP